MRGEKLVQGVSDHRKWFLGAGTAALTLFSAVKLGIEDLDKDTLRWTGGILAGVGGARLTYRKYFEKPGFESNENVGNKTKIPAIIASAGALAFAGSFIGGGGDGHRDEVSLVSAPNTAGDTPTMPNDDTTSSGSTSESTTSVSFEFPCEISAPINPEDVEGVKKLQKYLNEQGLDAGPEDGSAPRGGQTSQAVDRLQTALQLDPAAPWDELTCSLTPFGDGDSNTP